MKRLLVSIGIAVALYGAAPQESRDDDRPRLRRRERPQTGFRESYTEGSIFKPNSKTAEGTLKSVECRGKTARLHIVTEGKPVIFEVLDPKLVILKGTARKEFEFACGPQKPLRVAVEYVETAKTKSLYSLEIR